MTDENIFNLSSFKERLLQEKMMLINQQLEDPNLSINDKLKIIQNAEKNRENEVPQICVKTIDNNMTDKTDINVHSLSFSSNAYENVTIKELKNLLAEQDFILQQIALKSANFDTAVTEEEIVRINKELNILIAELWENHFSNLYLAFVFYAILEESYDNTKMIQFIQMKNAVLDLMLQYNANFSLSFERRGMYAIYNIISIIEEFKIFISSAEYLKELKSINESTRVNAISSAKSVNNPYEGYYQSYSNRKQKGGVSVNVIKIADIEIDPNKSETLGQKLKSLTSYFKIIRTDSESIFRKIETELNYNVSTGEVSDESTNERMLNMIQNTKYLKKYFQKADRYRSKPKLFLLNRFKLYSFTSSDPIPIETIGSYTLKPDAVESLMVKTTEKTQAKRNEASSIFDSNSTEAQKDFTNEVENECEKTSTQNEETSKYFDSQAYAHADTTVNVKICGRGADVNAETGIDVQGGISKDVQNERTESAKNINRAARKHMMNAKSKRDQTVSEATESMTEQQKEETAKSSFKNPNRDCTVDILEKLLADVITNFVVLDDIHIAFSNTISYELAPISQIDNFLRKYISKETAIENIKQFVKEATIVKDYQGRSIPFLDNNFNVVRRNFLTMLREKDIETNCRDITFEEYFGYIFGIPIVQDNIYLIKQGCLRTVPTGSKSCLGENEQALMDSRIDSEIVKIERERANTDTIVTQNRLKVALFDKKIMELEPEKAAKAFFLALSDSKSIFDKSNLLNVLGNTFENKEYM